MIVTALVFLIILTVLVLVHELGHFLVAKKLGIKVEEFGFGFPPRIFGIKKGETTYSVNWIFFGGFVKLYGEDEAGGGKISILRRASGTHIPEFSRAFFARPWQQRAAVVVAGVLMNALLAVVIYYGYLFLSGFKVELPLLSDHKFFLTKQQTKTEVIVSEIGKDSPAEKIGIKRFARIRSVNNVSIKDTKQFVEIINQNRGKEITISWVDEEGKMHSSNVTPRLSPPKGQGALGVAFFPLATAVLSYDKGPIKIFSGFIHPANLFVYNLDVIGRLVKVSFEQKSPSPLGQGVAGPVGIYSLVGNIIEIPNLKERVLQVLNLAGVLSLSLGFFNLLPIPALDGGRLFFILIEAVSGKRVNQRFESLAHAIGMAVLLTLIAIITIQDITRLILR